MTVNHTPDKLHILLLSPRGPLYRHRSGIWKKSLRYAPLTLTTLASLIPEEIEAEVTLVDEGINEIDPNVEAGLIGISAITGSAPRAYELADHFRRQGCFTFGFDSDTRDTFARTVEFVIDANIDLPRYAILTPFPGTPLFHRLKAEGRILTEDWSLYDAQHVVYQPKQMSPTELQRGTEWAWKQTYRFRSIAKRLMGARIRIPLSTAANLGYRFYAHHLHNYYNCDWMIGQRSMVERVLTT